MPYFLSKSNLYIKGIAAKPWNIKQTSKLTYFICQVHTLTLSYLLSWQPSFQVSWRHSYSIICIQNWMAAKPCNINQTSKLTYFICQVHTLTLSYLLSWQPLFKVLWGHSYSIICIWNRMAAKPCNVNETTKSKYFICQVHTLTLSYLLSWQPLFQVLVWGHSDSIILLL